MRNLPAKIMPNSIFQHKVMRFCLLIWVKIGLLLKKKLHMYDDIRLLVVQMQGPLLTVLSFVVNIKNTYKFQLFEKLYARLWVRN